MRLALALVAFLLLAGCDAGPSGSAGEQRGTLTIGLLPDEDPDMLRARYGLFVESVRARTGLDVALITPATYRALVERFAAGDIDLAYFGGYTFVLASERGGAVPLVMRDIDAKFVSYVLVHRDNDAVRELSDLEGARFSFGSRDSTSGHVMPRYFFADRGIVPEAFFSEVRYSGAHDRTVQQVADGTVDAGVANGQIVTRLLESGDEPPPVRILWQSPPYVNYVWAVQPSLSETTRTALKEVFLGYSTDNASHRRFLRSIGARYFVPARNEDFDTLRSALERSRLAERDPGHT